MGAFVSPATLEQIRAANDIVEFIGAVVPLKRAGANFVGICPFHKEKSPSFNVHPSWQSFHCFGCHKGGDVFTFVQEYESLTFPEAVKRLAERAHIPLEFEKGTEGPGRFTKDNLIRIHEELAQRWHEMLLKSPAAEVARAYLAKRKVRGEAIKLFRLGYSAEGWEDTVNWAVKKGFDLKLVEQAGLIAARDRGGYYDRFRGRLMFPIQDELGRVVAFSGRILVAGQEAAKYVNSPETPIFTKGKVFFGLDKSKREILDAGYAVVCEGQLDLIACYMAGVRNVVAPQGTAFTTDHARILKRYTNEVVLCFDSDVAGKAAVARVLDSLLASGLSVRVAVVPVPHDPDSYIAEFGEEAFRGLIEKAEGFFDFYVDQLCREHDVDSDKGRVAIVRSMAEAVHKADNVVLLDKYAQKTAGRLGVSADAVRSEFKKWARRDRSKVEAERGEIDSSAAVERPNPQEFWLLRLFFLAEEQRAWLAEHLDLRWIDHAGVRDLIGARQRLRTETGEVHPLHGVEDEGMRSLITEALAETRMVPDPGRQLQDVVLRLRNRAIDRELALLNQRLDRPGVGQEEMVLLVRRQGELRRMKQGPLAPVV